MKKSFILFAAIAMMLIIDQSSFAQTLKTVLNDQLKNTHTNKDWFVPVNVALEGVTAEQAMWKDGSGNHSIGQLAYHLWFWNERQLAKFKGEKESAFNGNNEETFDAFDKNTWAQTVSKLDKVLTDLEKIIQSADDAKLKTWAPIIANISAHNAYHTGQIVFVRKLQKSWDPEKGVK
ncbi:MAG: DinB family protein [Cyclobacteriaceae bacterium]|nr:DinB family protein [Cyclobacteriaceae bacterium]